MATTSVRLDQLDEVVQQLREVCRLSGIERALKIGGVVVTGCFAGDATCLGSGRKATTSYRKLVRRADLPLSASALNRAVGVYALSKRLPWIMESCNLSLAHLETVLPVGEDRQSELLLRAEAEDLSVRGFRALVRETKAGFSLRRGRPPLHPARRLRNSLTRIAGGCESMLAECERLGVDHGVVRRLHGVLSDLTELFLALDVELAPIAQVSQGTGRPPPLDGAESSRLTNHDLTKRAILHQSH